MPCIFSRIRRYDIKSPPLSRQLRTDQNKNTVIPAERIREEFKVIQSAINDPAGFELLYDRYYDDIYRFVWNRMNDKSFVADLVSDVFLKALINLPKFKFRGLPFSSWLYRVAINEVNQYYRNNQRSLRSVNINGGSLMKLNPEIKEDDPESLKILYATLNELSPSEMQVVELRIFENRSFKEVGEILKITENNSKVRYYRILDKISRIYKSKS